MENEEKRVKCHSCNWEGPESELPSYYDEVEMSNLEFCPNCEDAWSLNDLD